MIGFRKFSFLIFADLSLPFFFFPLQLAYLSTLREAFVNLENLDLSSLGVEKKLIY